MLPHLKDKVYESFRVAIDKSAKGRILTGMPRSRITLAPDALSALHAAELQEKDGPTRTRLQAVRLYALGYSVPDMQTITACSRSRLLEWWRAYRQDGVAALADHRIGGNNYKLTAAQRAEVRQYLHQYTPKSRFGPTAATPTGQFWTLADLRRAVTEWFGVTFTSPTSYYMLFAACDFSYQRPNQVFKSRRATAALDFEVMTEKN